MEPAADGPLSAAIAKSTSKEYEGAQHGLFATYRHKLSNDPLPSFAREAAMSDFASGHLVPPSFGAFKPVGCLMVGLPTQVAADALSSAFQQAGWPATDVLPFAPRASLAELGAMAENAGAMAGFGYEITRLRRDPGRARPDADRRGADMSQAAPSSAPTP